jgi:hypothetical protein
MKFLQGIRIAAAQLGTGDTAHFPGMAGKWTMARALIAGDLAALRMIPRMLRKRAAIERIRRLSPGDVRRLIFANRLSLRDTA